jgi:hypothetical protein
MKSEGALKRRFSRHGGIYRSDGSSLLVNLGWSAASRSGPCQAIGRAGRNTSSPIVRDEFRLAIPQRVARQHCPSPLRQQCQIKTIARPNGTIYHRAVVSLLTVCLTPGDKPSGRTLSREDAKKIICPVFGSLLFFSAFSAPLREHILSDGRAAQTRKNRANPVAL